MPNTYIDAFSITSVTGLSWQPYVGNLARFTSVQAQGATVLTVPATGLNAISVQLNWFDKLTLFDGVNTEIVQVGSSGAVPGATSIPLLSGTSLQYSHGIGVAWCSDGVGGSLADQIIAASAWIESECYQSLLQQTYTSEPLAMPTMRAAIDTDGALTFRPRHWPVTSVTGIAIAWTPTLVTTYDVTQAFIDGDKRLCSVPNLIALPNQQTQNTSFSSPRRSRKGQVQVTYQAGYAYNALPGNLKEAAVLVVSDLLAKQQNPMGADQLRQGDVQLITTLRGDFTGESLLIKRARQILKHYSVALY